MSETGRKQLAKDIARAQTDEKARQSCFGCLFVIVVTFLIYLYIVLF